MKTEIWKYIPDFNKRYMVSNFGNIKSVFRKKHRNIKISTKNGGYKFVRISKIYLGKAYNCYVHRLVMLSFIGHNRLTVNHKDGNKSNNKLSNLEYLSYKDNHAHAVKLGLRNIQGDSNGNSKLTKKQVKIIFNSKRKAKYFSLLYNVTPELIYLIRSKKVWRHIHE